MLCVNKYYKPISEKNICNREKIKNIRTTKIFNRLSGRFQLRSPTLTGLIVVGKVFANGRPTGVQS